MGYVDSENPWQKMKHALPQLDFKRVAVEFDNLILTKYHGLKTVFETAEFDNLTPRIQRMRLIKSADEVQKMMMQVSMRTRLLRLVLIIFLLIRLRQISSPKSTLP